MSEILTFNTENSSLQKISYDILPLYDEYHPMLSATLSDFDFKNPPVDPNKLAGDLLATMRAYNGIGLSANQCGLPYRVFVMEPNFVCFNPRVLSQGKMQKDKEGCLSFPGLWLHVERPIYVEAEYETASGITTNHRFEGLTARCYLHELDHMNGIKFTTYVGKTSLQLARQRQGKFIKKVTRDMKKPKVK